jgi:hypothetical protein
MANNEQNDKELNDYLNGDSDVSKAYRASNKVEPSAELDNAILSAAKEAVDVSNNVEQKTKPRFHKSPWVKPVSVAALVTLSVSLVVTMQQETGRPLISEPEIEMFDTPVDVKELPASKMMIRSDDAVEINEAESKQKKDERVDMDMSAPASLGATVNSYRAEEKIEAPKARMKEVPAKKMLLKEKPQHEVLEERIFSDEQTMQSAPASIELDAVVEMEQEPEFNKEKEMLLKIKELWEKGELITAKQVYNNFIQNYPDVTSENIKGILGENIYNGLLNY